VLAKAKDRLPLGRSGKPVLLIGVDETTDTGTQTNHCSILKVVSAINLPKSLLFIINTL